jgi:hypothetical protein
MTKSLMPGLVYGCGCFVGTERFRGNVALNMALIAFGVLVCALGEVNLVLRGLVQQLVALGFEVRAARGGGGGRWVLAARLRVGGRLAAVGRGNASLGGWGAARRVADGLLRPPLRPPSCPRRCG